MISPDMVLLRVLGQLRAEVEGRPADLGTSLQRAIIARLACAGGHVVSTDRFIEDLWQGQPPPKALGALQAYISNLRRALEPGRAPRTPATVLVTAPPGYRLHLGPDGVDAWRFPKLVEAAVASLDGGNAAATLRTVDEALALWTGPAYAEFADEEWAAAEASRLDELRLVAIEYRAEAALSLGRHAEVVPEMERHVSAHPLRENAVRLLALAYYRAGRQGAALAALRKTRKTLLDELGIDPGPALLAIEADILAQSVTLDLAPTTLAHAQAATAPAPSSALATGPATGSPLSDSALGSAGMIGREAELARLVSAAEQAKRGFRMAWLGGDAGSGKSTLAAALTRRLSADGWEPVVGRCPETVGGVPPAWAWSEVLRHLSAVSPPPPEVAVRLAPLLTDGADPVGQFRLAQAVGDYLERVPGPLVILLEDVHRADEETLQLLRHLAARLADTPVLLLLTHRPAESGADLMAAGAALAVQTTEHVVLRGLAEGDVARLLLERSGIEVAPDLVHAVTERTGGNPLFVAEIARLIATEGLLAAHALPPGVRDLIRRRVARLPATAQTALRNAAVLGREADADVLIAMPGVDEETVLDGLEAGVLSGLLEEPRPGYVRFAHVLVRETLYEDIPRLRRTRMHGKVVAALEQVRPGDAGALGHHALAAATTGTALAAAEYATRAAAQASGLYAHREAAAFLRGALDALDLASAPAETTRLDLLCRLVSALAHAGDVSGALTTRAKAIVIARKADDQGAVARAAAAFDAPVIWTIQLDRKLDDDLVRAIEKSMPATTGELRCRLLAALCHAVEGHDQDLVESASAEALAIARSVGDPRLLCMALNARYWVCLEPGRSVELRELGHELLDASESAGLLGYQTLGHIALCMAALSRNDLATARRHADRAAEHSTTGQLGLALTILAFLDAVLLVIKGEFEKAEAVYTDLSEQMAESGGVNALLFGMAARFYVRMASGRVHESLAEIAALRDRLEPDSIQEMHTRALVAAGRLDEAQNVWAAERRPHRDYAWTATMALRTDNAMALGHREVAEECYRLLLPAAGELAGLSTAASTLGPVAQTLGDLATFLGRTDEAAGHYVRAEEVARQVGSPHWARAARRALAAVEGR